MRLKKKYLRHYYRLKSEARKKGFSSHKFWAMNEREALDQYETKHGRDWKKIEVHQIEKPYAGCYGCFEITESR